MPTIQDTISKATKLKGAKIFKNKTELCIVIEDLAPELGEELRFIDRVYNNEVGRILFNALVESNLDRKKALLIDADRFLDEDNGRNKKWRDKLLSYFQKSIIGYSDSDDGRQRGIYTTTTVQNVSNNATSQQNTRNDESSRKIQNQKDAITEMAKGEELEKKGNLVEAFRHYYNAANLGNARGYFYVGYMFERGEGTRKDVDLAAKWYTRAAILGNRGAQHNLGYFYYVGTGVKQDFKKAFDYFMMAAKQGKPDSMLNIGVMYENGQYVDKDYEQALQWYRRAMDHGEVNAEKYYNSLKSRI